MTITPFCVPHSRWLRRANRVARSALAGVVFLLVTAGLVFAAIAPSTEAAPSRDRLPALDPAAASGARLVGAAANVPEASTNVVYANPIGSPSGASAWSLSERQFLAARFSVPFPTHLAAATAEFASGAGTFFVAVVGLPSTSALPGGTTDLATPFSAGEVISQVTFTRTGSTSGIETVPLNVDVPAGVYGVVIGSGLYGATGVGSLLPYVATTGSLGFFRSGPTGGPFVWRDTGSTQFNLALVTTGPAPVPVFTRTPGPRLVVNLGQNLNLSATAADATAYLWKRNGLPIAGATQPTYVIAGANHRRDTGWYQVTASNAWASASSPVTFVNVAAGGVVAWGDQTWGQATVPAGLSNLVAVSAGLGHSLAVRADGTVVAWGSNSFGQLNVPAGLTDVVAVVAGNSGSLALKADGTLVGWGNTSVPAGVTNGVAVALDFHTLVLKADGTVVGAGGNDAGQISIPSGLGGVVGVAANSGASLALKADGTVVAWGSNLYGQTTMPSGLGNVVGVAIADRGYALKADGTVAIWGAGLSVGQTRMPAGLSGVVAVDARSVGSSALLADGTVSTWGLDSPPAGLSRIVSFSQGDRHVVALRDTSIPGAPTITIQPNNAATAALTGNTTFRVEATGNPAPTYQWQRQPAGTTGFADITNNATYAGATTAALAVTAPALAQSGDQFRCVATNPAGSATSQAATLTVLVAPTITSAASVTFFAGTNGSFPITASGSPTPTFSVNSGSFPSWASLNPTTGVISGTPPDTTGSPFTFGIRAGNAYQSAFQTFTLNVQAAAISPTISLQPTDAAAVLGGNATFTVAAQGEPAPTLQWQRRLAGSAVFADLSPGGTYLGVTGPTLSVSGVGTVMNGDQFRAVATNPVGVAVSSAATLSVLTGGAIVTHPVGRTVMVGQPLALSVTAAGSGPFSYQWRRNGVFLPGATTATFSLAAAKRSDAAVYDVEVTANAVLTRSQPARVWVAPTAYPGRVGFDPTFSIPVERGGAAVNALKPLADGRVLAAGEFVRINDHVTSGVARFLADGAVDRSFVAPGFDGAVRCLAMLPDGRMLAGGDFGRVGEYERAGVVRLNADGSVDPTYRLSAAGGAAAPIASVRAILVLGDGRIIVGGIGPLLRFSASGVLEPEFSPLLNSLLTNLSLALTTDGKIIVGGYLQVVKGGSPTFRTVVRLNADGTDDAAFNATSPTNFVTTVLTQGDGKVYVGSIPNSASVPLTRLNANGTVDPAFSPLTVLSMAYQPVLAAAFDASGKIVVATSGGVARYTTTGSLDTIFPGFVAANEEGPLVTELLPRADGSLWIGGRMAGIGGVALEAIGRFAAGSTVATPVGTTVNRRGTVASLVTDAGGQLLVGGEFRRIAGVARRNLARINSDGTVDASFVAAAVPDGRVAQVLRLADGRLMVLGSAASGTAATLTRLVRLSAEGAADSGFAFPSDGTLWGPLGITEEWGGRLLLYGRHQNAAFDGARSIVRLLADGSVDTAFVNGGPSDNATVQRAFVSPDGRVVAAGSFALYNGVSRQGLVRLLANGAVDTTFAAGGGFTNDAGAAPVAQLGLTPGNRWVVGGSFTRYAGTAVPPIVRLNADGAVDSGFALDTAQFSATGVSGLLIQEDDRVLAWTAADGFFSPTAAPRLVRLTSGGATDASFAWLGLRNIDQLSALALGDAGQLYCALANRGEVLRSAPATPPAVTVPPADQVALAGGNVVFSVAASAVPAPSYQWFRNGSAVSGATGATLALTAVSAAQAGSYSVVVTNELGSATSRAATLVVSTSTTPAITLQPVSQTVVAGQPAAFSVGVYPAGATPAYQWRRQGVPISGATTATFALPSTRVLDDAYYQVVVTAGATTLESDVVYLSVAPTRYPTGLYLDPTFAPAIEAVGGTIYQAVAQPDGKLVVAGDFSRVGGGSRRFLARLQADGSIDPTFAPGGGPDGNVRAVVLQSDGKLLLGGEFTRYNGVPRGRLARLHADGTLDLSFDTSIGANNTVLALALAANGDVWLGGEFTSVNGSSRSRLARLTSGGANVTPFSAGAGPDYSVQAIALQPDGRLLIGGSFTSYDGVSRSRVARVHADGSLDPTFNRGSSSDYMVLALAVQSDGKILIGGGSYSTPSYYFGRVNADGSPDPSFNLGSGASNEVSAIVVQPDGRILVGGWFSTFNGQLRSRLARLNADGSLDGFVGDTNDLAGQVRSLAVLPDGRIAAAGTFYSYANDGLTGLRMLLAGGQRDAAFTAETRVPGQINELIQQPDGRLLLAGRFNYVNGVARAHLARLLPDGGLDPSFQPGSGLERSAEAMVLQPDGKIVVGGFFSSYNGVLRARVVRINTDGSLDSTFNPGAGPDFGLTCLELQPDGRLLIGGAFTSVAGTARNHVARLQPNGALDPTFDPGAGADGWVYSFAVQPDGRILLGGWFNSYQGQTRGGIARVLANGTLDSSFNSNPGSAFGLGTLLLQPDGRVVVGGSLNSYGGVSRLNLARTLGEGSLDTSFVPGDVAGVGIIGALFRQADGRLILGQEINSSSGLVTSGLARITASGAVDPTFLVAGLANAKITRFLLLDDGRMLVAGEQFNDGLTTQAGVARLLHLDAPAITAPPVGQTAVAGSSVTFSVAASGGRLGYQWQFNGQPIAGATQATLTLGNLGVGSGGSYAVEVSNALGRVLSAPAALNVSGLITILSPPTSRAVGVGGATVFSVVAASDLSLSYQWRRQGVAIPGATAATLSLPAVAAADAGDYAVLVANPYQSQLAGPAVLTVLPNPLVYSARQYVGAGGAWGYFSIEGGAGKKVLLRAAGPALAVFGLTGVLADPSLTLYHAAGGTVAANDNWGDVIGSSLATVTAQVGAFPFAAGSRDASLVATLAPGSYAVRVSGTAGATGLASLELYDAEVNPASRLAYVGLRGRTDTTAGTFTGGLTMTNSAAKRLLIRAVGPSLGTAGAHPDPLLRIVDGGGLYAENDQWGGGATLASAMAAAGAFPLPAASLDAAVLVESRVGTGTYTAQVPPGVATGEVLFEFYDLPASGASALAPLVVVGPPTQTVATGETVTLRALAIGRAPLSFQWRRNGTAVAGATDTSLVIASAAAAQAGTYDVVVSNGLGTALSSPGLLTVGTGATHATSAVGYFPGGTVTITNTLSFTGAVGSLGWSVVLPSGWTFAADAGASGDVRPVVGDSGTLSWAWLSIPASPVVFTYTVNIPAGESATRTLSATALVRPADGTLLTLPVGPGPIELSAITAHSGDADRNLRISLIELTRMIELYNVRNGTLRTGAYAVAVGASEDGFAPEPTRAAGSVVTLGRYHSADSNRDGRLSLLELTRVIELFNYRSGTTRTGQYHVQPDTEDGFAPGP